MLLTDLIKEPIGDMLAEVEGDHLRITKRKRSKIVLDWTGYCSDIRRVTADAVIHCTNVEIIDQLEFARMTVLANNFAAPKALRAGMITVAWTAYGCDIAKHAYVRRTAKRREWSDMIDEDFDSPTIDFFYELNGELGCARVDLGAISYVVTDSLDERAVKATTSQDDDEWNYLFAHAQKEHPRPKYSIADYIPANAEYIEIQYDGLQQFIIDFADYRSDNLRSIHVDHYIGISGVEYFISGLRHLHGEIYTDEWFICPEAPSLKSGTISFASRDTRLDLTNLPIYFSANAFYVKYQGAGWHGTVAHNEEGIHHDEKLYLTLEEFIEAEPELAARIGDPPSKKNAASA